LLIPLRSGKAMSKLVLPPDPPDLQHFAAIMSRIHLSQIFLAGLSARCMEVDVWEGWFTEEFDFVDMEAYAEREREGLGLDHGRMG
jgi:hypothetical protein